MVVHLVRARVRVRAGSKVAAHLRCRISPSLLLKPLNLTEHGAPLALLELALLQLGLKRPQLALLLGRRPARAVRVATLCADPPFASAPWAVGEVGALDPPLAARNALGGVPQWHVALRRLLLLQQPVARHTDVLDRDPGDPRQLLALFFHGADPLALHPLAGRVLELVTASHCYARTVLLPDGSRCRRGRCLTSSVGWQTATPGR